MTIAFGRHIPGEPRADSASAITFDSQNSGEPQVTSDALKFTFERDPTIRKHAEPYHLQGDEDFDKTLPRQQRDALFHDPHVQRELRRFWDTFSKTDDGNVEKREYMVMHDRMAKVLIPSLTTEEMHASGEDDWESDAHGGASI